ncbi:MAG: hypothetical protein PF588_01075 [Candidatus Kapabacteria bacterium]|nr:hypothetical protein [Candidatus Kapabacteria bacterium]
MGCSSTTKLSDTNSGKKPNYNMKFLRAMNLENENSKAVLVLFHVSPKKKEDFPPVVSMKLGYKISDSGIEKSINISKSKGIVELQLFDKSIREKSPAIYNVIKDKIDINIESKFWILAFYYFNSGDEAVDKMTMTYGLWEKNNHDIRIEEKFEFNVE